MGKKEWNDRRRLLFHFGRAFVSFLFMRGKGGGSSGSKVARVCNGMGVEGGGGRGGARGGGGAGGGGGGGGGGG